MKEEMGKFYCPKCTYYCRLKSTIINSNLPFFFYFRVREENGIKKWIFNISKSFDFEGKWFGGRYNSFSSIKDCWEVTGGFSEDELDVLSGKNWECISCSYKSNTFKTFINQKQSVKSEENNQLKILEKELQEEKIKTVKLENEIKEEKNKNIILNETIKSVMNELKEIKAAVFTIQNKSS